MKQAIMIGAGNIGRGFIGAILSRSGYHVTFADVNMTLIDAINAESRYTVHIQDRNPAAFTITNIDGISSAGPELAEALKTAELVTTAVGLRILPIVAKLTDVRIVNNELKTVLGEVKKEYWMMVCLVVGNIPLLYMLNTAWFEALMFSIPGKIVLAICGVVILITAMFMMKYTKPIEYKK